MTPTRNFMSRLLLSMAAVAGLAGCNSADALLDQDAEASVGSSKHAITDVPHTPIEKQSIGNCWLYAQATWLESMSLSADPSTELDVSQSYWTYWHWFDQVTNFFPPSEIRTGGFQHTAHSIVRDRGFMAESAFVLDDTLQEKSLRQKSALTEINAALERGDFDGADSTTVRKAFDEAWGLSDEVRAQLDQAFGEDGEGTLRQGADLVGTEIVDPAAVTVKYTERQNGQTEVRETDLVEAITSWEEVRFPRTPTSRRAFMQRVQRALHDKQPVVITWDVDFNALSEGTFNLTNLEEAGKPGRQGGHMTVLEDYEAETEEFGLLEAGVTLDPSDPNDAEKLEAALLDSTEIKFLRIKNSWGTSGTGFDEGFEGYHDLAMDYLTGPIPFCPGAEDPTNETCFGESIPLRTVMLPPGY